MLATVFLPMAVRGRVISTRGSLAVRLYRASADTIRPGAMMPPAYSPLGVTTSKVVAVPKSTTMAPSAQRAWAATAFTIRSAPTSRGFS
jgi:hypothetical protein